MAEPDPAGTSGVPQDAETLGEVLAALEAEGFGQSFVPREGGTVRIPSSGAEVDVGALRVASVHRLEGASDPDDMVLVAAVEAPGGERGTLVLGYGPNASATDGDTLLALELPG